MNDAVFDPLMDLYDILIPTMEQNALDIQFPITVIDRQLGAAIESLLFVSGRPLERAELRKLLDVDNQRLSNALHALKQDLDSQGRGIRLQTLGEKVQLVTAPENAHYVAALLGLPITAKLTPAALETLAVIAYRQPLTRSQIEAIRGVNSDRALASLLQHGLVAEIGRAQTVGRPALFATTAEFLQQFGLTSLDQLPGTTLGEQPATTEPVTQTPAENANGTGAVSPVALETNKEHSEEH